MKYSSNNKPLECMMTQSTCYKGTEPMKVLGVLWHSTGANNPNLKRYVQPDDKASNRSALLAKLGTNSYKNDWNHIKIEVGLNAWIGKFADGTVGAVQTMPWNYRPWGCGSGSKGSCNNGWIQFEICEDDLTDKSYFNKVYEEAAQLTAYLCKMYNIDPNGSVTINGVKVPTILCHADSHALGFGSGHSDVNHWFPKFGKSMATARARVAEIIGSSTQPTKPSAPGATNSIEVGDLVSIASNATYWNGAKIPNWVKNQKWYVYSVGSNGRIVINQNEKKTNTIMSPIDKKYLTVVSVKKFKSYKVKVTVDALNYRAGAGTENKVNGTITDKGVYTIVAEAQDSKGYTWGKLKSGAGWISLQYTKKI